MPIEFQPPDHSPASNHGHNTLTVRADDDTAANAIVLAAVSNTLVRARIVWGTGSPGIRRAVLPGAVAAVVVALGLAFAF